MKILFLSTEGDGLGVADKLQQEGHDVVFWCKDQKHIRDLTGFITRPDSWRPHVPSADLIICDMVGHSHNLPTFQRYAKPVLCCNAFADLLELDRIKGMQLAEALKIDTPVTYTYSSATEAKNRPFKGEVYVKPCGNKGGPIATRRATTPAIYDYILSSLDPSSPVLIQEVVPEGVEVSTEGWFNGADWVHPFNHTFEEKKLMSGGGVGTGCMGNVVVRAEPDRLIKETLLKLTPFLRKASWKGPIDCNCIVTKDRAYLLEFTARMGYDAIEALMCGMREPIGTFLFEVATGVKKEMALTKDYMMAVRLVSPPYPYAGRTAEEGQPLEGIGPENRKYIYLIGAMKKKGKLVTSGSDGIVAKVTATGRSVDEAQNRVYRTLDNIKGIDLFYRDDIGKRVPKELRKLKEWGWV